MSDTPNQSAVSAANKSTVDRDALKRFYFSKSSQFSAFKGSPAAQHDTAEEPTATVGDVSLGQIDVSMPSPIPNREAPAATPTPGAKVGLSGLRSMTEASRVYQKHGAQAQPTKRPPPPDAASVEYFEFLKQQQELQNQHGSLEKEVASLIQDRQDHQARLAKLRRQAAELVSTIENGPDWKLRSKYTTQQLLADCTLSLQPVELSEDRPATTIALKQLASNMTKIKSTHGDKPAFEPHALFVEQALRRIGLLEQVLEDTNLDATDLARVPDSFVVQLEKVNALASVESLVEAAEAEVDKLTFKTDEARRERAQAVEDGEVHQAEQLCYDIVDAHEAMLKEVLRKINSADGAIAENDVLLEVHSTYLKKAKEEIGRVLARGEKLKGRCEDDVKKMFALREKVEEVETATGKKVAEERQRSDGVLADNARKTEVVFAKMTELEKELEVLERERHREVQKRIAEKDKDEHRRAEFARFCGVMDEHLEPLQRTIKNTDAQTHCAEVVQELVDNGFASLQDDLHARGELLRDVKLEAHKQHVEVFRGLLVELGEVVYKKERMVEETDKSVQQAHVQQELLAETFNPNARKFGDVKKKLLANRSALEDDVAELKERAADALQQFAVTEAALEKSQIDFVHPVTEVEHHTLALRARMMEFKAAVAGHVEGQAVMRDITQLKDDLIRTRAELEERNAETSGTINRTLPMIKAALKARER